MGELLPPGFCDPKLYGFANAAPQTGFMVKQLNHTRCYPSPLHDKEGGLYRKSPLTMNVGGRTFHCSEWTKGICYIYPGRAARDSFS